ncbi:MAG: hypothetical protein EOM66_02955 [Clostridia bacterium]|nr:hypothetical protein [Clostridia bacterium]
MASLYISAKQRKIKHKIPNGFYKFGGFTLENNVNIRLTNRVLHAVIRAKAKQGMAYDVLFIPLNGAEKQQLYAILQKRTVLLKKQAQSCEATPL